MDVSSFRQHESDCPEYSELAVKNLIPMTTLKNNRYYNSSDFELSHMVINPGPIIWAEGSQPMYLPPDWAAFIHPEGKPYFYRNVGLHVVTEAYLFHLETMDRVSSWVSSVEDAMHMKGIIPASTMELFLEPRDDLVSCGYYFVDHATQTEFWIDQGSTKWLDMEQVVSTSHLKAALEELYWIHVEYFPMHVNCVSKDTIEQLISVFSHGQTDRMTSSTSTFTYDVDTCMKFIRLLTDARERDIDGHTTWIVARLWRNIVSQRVLHHFGQESPRLDRNQSILGIDRSVDHWLIHICAYLSFGLSELHHLRLNEIFVDQWVNIEDFRNLFSQCMNHWKSSLSQSLTLLVANALILSVPAASQFVGLLAIIMCGMSATTAIVLCIGDRDFEKGTGTSALSRLDALRSETYGFRLTGLVFSLPEALCLWGLGLLMAQVLVLAACIIHPSFAIGMAGIVILVGWGTGQTVFVENFWFCNWVLENCFSFFQRYGRRFKLRRRR